MVPWSLFPQSTRNRTTERQLAAAEKWVTILRSCQTDPMWWKLIQKTKSFAETETSWSKLRIQLPFPSQVKSLKVSLQTMGTVYIQTTLLERRQLPASPLAPDVKRTRTRVITPPSGFNDCYLASSFIKKDWDFSRFVFSSLQSHLLLRQLKLWKFIIMLFSVLFFVPYYSLFPFVLLASWSG